MLLNIVGGSYDDKYLSVNPQKTINWYIHKDLMEVETSRYKMSLKPTPGLAEYIDTTKTRLRGLKVARTLTRERCFVVADNYLYEITDNGNPSINEIGQMTAMDDDPTTVYMEVNGNDEIMIAHSSASYIFDMTTDTLTQITDSDFPNGITSLAYSAGYFLITSGGRVYFSNLNDGLNWNAADLFTPTAKADKTLAVVVWRDDIYCFGTETIEVYINDGTNPFSKQGRDTLDIGIVNFDTLTTFDDGILFLGKATKGEVKPYFYNGQELTIIAPFSVNWQLANPSVIYGKKWEELTEFLWEDWFDAWGAELDSAYSEIEYTKDGHLFWYVTIPTLHTTYVYDTVIQEWTERQSLNPSSNTQQEFRGKWCVNFKGKNLFTDIHTGKILQEDYTIATEDGATITRTRTSRVLTKEKLNLSIYSFELDTTTGLGLIATPATDATIDLYVSRDGGNTYSSALNLSTGSTTEYTARPRVHKLGTARDWVFKLVQTDAADIAINEGIIRGVVGSY